jgi:glucan phosphoethanolaminetransferase (alkaline phosphatase superfamily)
VIDMQGPSYRVARIALGCAWILPVALVAFSHRSALQIAVLLAIGLAPAGIVAALPARAFKIACVVSVLALPFTVWWCGFAALEHAGPGLEAAQAVGGVTFMQAMEIAGSVAREGPCLIVILGHTLLLFVACRSAFWSRPAAPSRTVRNVRQVVLLLSLLPLCAAAVFGMDDFNNRKASLFGAETLSSPLGAATDILVEGTRSALWNHELEYRRPRAVSSTHITAPILALFVIGESVRADVYGPTQAGRGAASRELDERIKHGLGSWLPTTCASSDGTGYSVPLLITALGPDRRDEMPTTPTVLGILKASGFTTAWLANNEAGKDIREAGHDLYAGTWALQVDPSFSKPHATRGMHWRYDEEMVPVARSFIGTVDRPKGLILHTFGSHFVYTHRYPAEAFPPAPPGLDSDTLQDLQYAHSAEYGVRTLLQFAALLDTTPAPAFLVYTSDHGENLHSDHNGVALHLGPRTTVEDATVPSFVLWNAAMAAQRDPAQVLSKLTSAKLIAHADVAKLFLALSGVSPGPVEPTADPKIWGRIEIGQPYSPVRCSAVKP